MPIERHYVGLSRHTPIAHKFRRNLLAAFVGVVLLRNILAVDRVGSTTVSGLRS
jgi:hypothetical protein